jgi:hypothetical protein
MSNWHRELDREMQARREAEEKRKVEEKARLKKEREEQEAEVARIRLQAHQLKFRCHICGRPSDGPRYDTLWNTDPTPRCPAYIIYSSWDIPSGLKKCSICDRCACYDKPEDLHISHGICKRRYERGYRPGDKRKWWDLLL